MALYRRFPRYVDFTDFTPVIPEIYWNVYSSEQRIRALCCEWVKLVAYVDGMADTVNDQYKIIEDMEARLPELVNADVIAEIQRLINSGEFKQFIEQAIADFEAEIRGDITALQNGLSSETANRSNADTALGNRIDAEQAARSNADTALGNRVTEEASARSAADTALGNRLTAEQTARENADTKLSNRVSALEAPHMIVIGDSWMVSTRQTTNALLNSLNVLGANTHNFSEGGTGFLRSFGTNFSTQLENAIADTSINKKSVKYIAICGGTNDYGDGFTNAEQYISVMEAMRIRAKALYPNATILFFFMQYAKNRQYPLKLIRDVQNGVWCNVVNMFPMFPTNAFADNLHLNTEWQKKAGRYMASCFNAGKQLQEYTANNQQVITQQAIEALGGTTKLRNLTMREVWTENSVTVYMYMDLTENLSANEFNAWVEGFDFYSPIMPPVSTYMRGQLVNLTEANKINVTAYKDSRDNKCYLGVRNTGTEIAGFYTGAFTYIWQLT